MPILTSDPTRTVLNKSVSVHAASTINTVAKLCNANSLNFSSRAMLHGAQICIQRSIQNQHSAIDVVRQLLSDIKDTLTELGDLQMADPTRSSGFVQHENPMVRLLANVHGQYPIELLQAVGNMLITSHLTTNPPSKNRMTRLNTIAMAAIKEPALSGKQIEELQVLLHRSERELVETLAQAQHTCDLDILKFNSNLLVHLRSDLNSEHVHGQQMANPRAYMEVDSIEKEIKRLEQEMLAGDWEALVILIAFSLNISWDLVLDLPLQHPNVNLGALMWIEPVNGLVHLTLSQLLYELGQAVTGCMLTSETMRLPLTDIVARQLHTCALLHPTARRLGDLLQRQARRQPSVEDYWSASQRAKFIRSAPRIAIQLQPNRAVAAYAFLAFNLVTEPDLPYLTISEDQIWSMRATTFSEVGLGEIVSTTNLLPANVGSKRTPEFETMQLIFQELQSAVENSRVGRNCSLSGLIQHHNSYTKWVAFYLHFVASGRATKEISFSASSWFDGALYGFLDDKNVGAAGGRTPIPITPRTRQQLRLLNSHYRSLDARLIKLLGVRANLSSNRIQAIMNMEDVQLLFFLSKDGIPLPILGEGLFEGSAKEINRDLGRHYVPTHLSASGYHLSLIHLLLRHQGEAINPQSAFGTNVLMDDLLVVALALDDLLQDIGAEPLKGLSGGKS